MDEKKENIENRVLKIEGEIYSFLLKTQEYDKKIQQFSKSYENYKQIEKNQRTAEENYTETTKRHTARNNEIVSRLYDFEDKLKKNENKLSELSDKLNNFMKIETEIEKLSSFTHVIIQTQIDNLTKGIESLAYKTDNNFSELKKTTKNITDAVDNCVKKSVYLEEVHKLNNKIDFDHNIFIDAANTLNENINAVRLSNEKLNIQCEEFKKNATEKLNAVLEAYQLAIDKKFKENTPKDLSPQLIALQKDQESLKLDVENHTLRKEIVDRELDLFNRKLEKVFLIIKKIEQAQEA